MQIRVVVTATLTLMSLLISGADAARIAQQATAMTDPAETGPEYGFQGEYVGMVSGGFRRMRLGLQIVAGADQQLHAVEYRGGLPGSGWDGSEKIYSAGIWNKSVAVLNSESRQIVIVNREMWILSSAGTLRGIIKKVHRQSPTLGLRPPQGADVLFDGHSTIRLQGGRMTNTGLLKEGAETLDPVDDFRLHLEFRTPFMPAATGQARGNSGVYIQRRYELQILDSFGLQREYNFCGSLYKTRPPDVNMCLPPLAWQTYDVWFRTARFDVEQNKIADARITVLHNGIKIHDNIAIPNKTGAGRPEGPDPLTILFQDHNDPVRFRNIWLMHQRFTTDRENVKPLPVFGRLNKKDSLRWLGVLPATRTDAKQVSSQALGIDRH